MKNTKYLLASLVILLALVSGTAFAKSATDPCSAGIGARPLGMGRAFAGMADDSNAIFLNPGGLGFLKSWELTSMSTTLLTQVSYKAVGGVYPTAYGVLGLGLVNTSAPGGYTTQRDANGRIIGTGETINYGSNVLLLSYSHDMNRVIRMRDSHLSLGANVKVFQNGFSGGGMDGKGGSGLDVDLGAVLKANDWLTVGGVFQNIWPQSMGGAIKWSTETQEGVPSLTKWGGSVNLIGRKGLYKIGRQEVYVNGDIDYNFIQKHPIALHLGAEWKPVRYISIRTGLDQDVASVGENQIGTLTNFTAGVGLNYRGFRFDYAYKQNSTLAENSTHYFSIAYLPGEAEKEIAAEKEEQLLAEKKIQPEVSELKPVDQLEQKWTKLLNGKSAD